MEDLAIKYKGKVVKLSKDLIKRNGVSFEAISRLKTLYYHKMILFEAMENIDDSKTLRKYDIKLTKIEFEIQKRWNFKPDLNYHKFWERPKCTCPKMDNNERWGTGYSIINGRCPLHGVTEWSKKGIV